ncbi:MAG: hypothetical protein RMY27_31790 [Nostoc sp. DedQUE09]|nr:hypothetical protein [Nostoc sp. DedQUE09]
MARLMCSICVETALIFKLAGRVGIGRTTNATGDRFMAYIEYS